MLWDFHVVDDESNANHVVGSMTWKYRILHPATTKGKVPRWYLLLGERAVANHGTDRTMAVAKRYPCPANFGFSCRNSGLCVGILNSAAIMQLGMTFVDPSGQ